MNIKSLLIAILLTTFCFYGFGQKVKYKDLIVLLNNRQFDDAEPYLKKYLKENTDNPNAYLFMALIYQEKAAKLNLLKDTYLMVSFLDSTVYFAGKAKAGITERELSRNEDYYQLYSRRNLRTGKFDITLSDVQLALENMLKLKDRATTILTLKSQFGAAQNAYTRANRLFLNIQKRYPGLREFYLRADETSIIELKYLAQVYDSCHMHFNDYKQTTELLVRTGYNQDIDPQEIIDFKTDGQSPVDFYRDDLKLWDYRRWALKSVGTIEKDIIPLQEGLVSVDAEINKLHQILKRDSASMLTEISDIRHKITFPELKKIDPNPLPLTVFEIKLSELEYGSQVARDRILKDSLKINLHILALRKELIYAREMDSLASSFLSKGNEGEVLNYHNFITKSFGSAAVLEGQIKSTKEFAEKEIARKERDLKKRVESLRWIIALPDSIPLFNEVSSKNRFKPFVLVEDKFTAGIQFGKDSTGTGYFYTIAPSRKADVKASYPIDKQAFIKRNMPYTKAIGIQDERGKVFFILLYSEVKVKDKIPATLVKIYKQEGVSWSINYTFDQTPAEIVFSPDTFEISVKTKSSLGEFFIVSFDKNGKVIK